jgi:HAD superfamily hydrolase (TIGR01549 family)
MHTTAHSQHADTKCVNQPETHLALFDLDNTLVDRQSVFARWARSFSLSRGLGEEGIEVLCDADDDGFATREAVFTAVRRKFRINDTIEELVARYRVEYPEMFQPDLATQVALQRLRATGWRLGIVTNGPLTQHEKIRRAGLTPLVDAVCVSEEFGVAKPNPRIFAEAIRRCCGPVSHFASRWMIGDSPEFDIAGGIGAGLRTAWLHHGRSWITTAFAPDIVASDLNDVIEKLFAATQSDQL